MALDCNFGVVNTNKFKALQALENYCGSNITQFAEYVYFVIDHFEGDKAIPMEDFAKWYSDNYKSELNFNAGEGLRMKDAILKYYNDRKQSVEGNSKKSAQPNSVALYGYSSASARNFAKRFTARMILDIHSRLNYRIQHSDRNSYEDFQRDKAELIAKDITNSSKLSEEKKTELLYRIENEAVTQEDIRKILAQNNLNSRFDINAKNKTYYFDLAQAILRDELADRIAIISNLTYDEIENKLNEHLDKGGVREWIETNLGSKNMSLQDANLLALFDEFALNKEAFIEEVCLNSDLAEFRFEDQERILDSNETNRTNAEADNDETREDGDETIPNDDDDANISIVVFDHSGLFTTAMMHVQPNLKAYFNSLRKLNSKELLNREVDEDGNVSGDPDYDKNNPLGVYDTMNANECASILYHYGNYTNIEAMIASIEDIADRIPGFKAFYTLAQDLRTNEDFALEVYRTFGKLVIGKTVTIVKDGKGGFELVNRRNNKQESFRLELLNSIKTSVINNNVEFYREKLKLITDVVSNTGSRTIILNDRNSSARKKIINQLYEVLKPYYGTIDAYSIENYININRNEKGNIDVLYNIGKLIDIAKMTLDGAAASQASYDEFEKERRTASDNNYKINRLVDVILERDSTGKLNEDSVRYNLVTKGYSYVKEQITDEILQRKYKFDSYEIATLESVYTKPYLSFKSLDALTSLSKELVDYSLVKVELNSANVHNNQSSDVINSSTLTTMINTLRDEVVLKKYGESRAQSRQYQFSNIFWEHIDTETKETIYGLFRKDANGNVVVTEYAKDLLKIRLFDGARSRDNGLVALYKEMSKADYIGTAFLNYYTDNQVTRQGNVPLGTYFMRTPSDAPRNFTIQAPRYNTNNLFTITNIKEIDEAIKQERIKVLSKSITEAEANSYDNNGPVTLKRTVYVSRVDSFIKQANNEDGFTVKLPEWTKTELKAKVGDEVTLRFQYKTENTGKDENIYTITGIYSDGKLTECHFNGIVNSKISTSVYDTIDANTRAKLDKDGVTVTINDESKVVKTIREVNLNNILFKILKRRFRQEILDAAIAIDKFFETWPNGLVRRYSADEAAEAKKRGLNVEEGDIIWKEGISHNGREVVGAYDNYHHKKGVIVERDETTGREKLVGNVFNSNIFTVFDETTGKDINFGNDLIKELFDFLYGGANNNFIQVIKDGEGHNATVIDVNLKNADEAINSMIERFILKYTESATERLSQFEDAIPIVDLSFDNVSDFVLNYHIAYLGFDDMFEGNSKFYKDSQTFLKRAKEVQGSGTPYGILDFRSLFDNEIQHVRDIRVGGRTVSMYNKFKAVTVVNTVQTGTTIGKFKRNEDGKFVKNERGHVQFTKKGALADKLIEVFEGEGYSTIAAEDKAADLLSGYADTTVNDAQSYITFEEWIRRITARGQLPKYLPLIEKIYANEEFTVDELTEFVQVQKNFYYDLHYDKDAGLYAPRQIKNAEFVLIPQFIQGTHLEAVEKMMKKYGIDQLNTEEASKAGKTNTLEIFDAKTGEVKQDVLNELYGDNDGNYPISLFGQQAEKATQIYDYGFLYTQQETPQHVNSKNKAAIQIMKKIVDNIPYDQNHPLYEVKKRFFALYCANIRDSFDSLIDELNIEKDENGNIKLDETGYPIGLNKEVFYERLKQELMRRGLDSNAMDYVYRDPTQPLKSGTERIMPEYVSMFSQKLENVAQAIFNSRITRQKLNGFHAAQISNNGFKPLSNTVSKRSYSKDLKYHPDGKPYIEIMVPASYFGFNRYNEDESLKDKDTLLKELQDAKLDEIIGYRIPTEGKQSIAIMKVVGFLDDSQGSTIVVPNDWVAQTGSDFDIDSVYGIQFATGLDANGKIRKIGYSNVASRSYEEYVKNAIPEEQREELINDKDFNYDSYAVVNNLQSRDEFSENNPDLVTRDNTREARNNELVECMLIILRHSDMLEENLSRSNFKDITDALDAIIPPILKKRRISRSAYNFLDQADYQEDAMAGAKLKAFSVTRDTFCSVCNTVKPYLKDSHSITVAYDKTVISKENAVKRFGEANVEVKGNKILITHNRLGWSLDNKNVVDKILTAYSSQTTAHILDAIKEGSVPNVNDLTFAVYKLFPDLGIDYETAIGFIMQNGIKRVINNYNATKSVYTTSTSKPIIQTIRDIAIELGYDPYEFGGDITLLLSELQNKYGEQFAKLFGTSTKISLNEEDLNEFVIDKDNLKANLTSPLTGIDGLLYDLGIVLQYAKFDKTAQSISKYTRVCNPDKFGAKQSIYATNKIFEDIEDIVTNDENDAFDNAEGSFIDKIYPGLVERKLSEFGETVNMSIENFVTSSPQESKYPSLYYFLKYSTAPSVIINRQLFKTEDPGFKSLINRLESYLPNGRRISEKEYTDFKKYIIGALYNQCETLTLPIGYANDGFVFAMPADVSVLEKEDYKQQERERIFGYGVEPMPKMTITEEGVEKEVPFSIENIAHPTLQDIERFIKLTPAQKVAFIQKNFRNIGIFGALQSSVFNDKTIVGKKAGSQTIRFVDTTRNIEDCYIDFEEAFNNNNPLVALAAYDLVKYAFIVEGYKMSKSGISKIIPNSVLYTDFGKFGTGVITELKDKMNNIATTFPSSNNPDEDAAGLLCERFVKANADNLKISEKRVKINSKGYLDLSRHNGIVYINIANPDGKRIAKNYNLVYESKTGAAIYANSFVKLRFPKEDDYNLYKVVRETTANYDMIYAYPVSMLDDNEYSDVSVNPNNNVSYSEDYYKTILDSYFNKYGTKKFTPDYLKEIVSEIDKTEFKIKAPKQYSYIDSVDFNIDNPPIDLLGTVDFLKDRVQKQFGTEELDIKEQYGYIMSPGLGKYIRTAGEKYKLTKPFIVNKNTKNERFLNIDIVRLDYSTINNIIIPYLMNKNQPIAKGHKEYSFVIEDLRQNNISNPQEPIFILKPNVTGIRQSKKREHKVTTTGIASDLYSSIYSRAKSGNNDDRAKKAIRRFNRKGVNRSFSSIKANESELLMTGVQYVVETAEDIMTKLRYFVSDPSSDGYLSVTDPKVIPLLAENESLKNEFLKLINDAEALVRSNRHILELDINSQDKDIQIYLNKLKEVVSNLQNNNILNDAKVLFANECLGKSSKNPVIRQDIINILDGYYSTNAMNAMFSDLQETSNPFVQVLTKQIMSDISAKDAATKKAARAWIKKWEDIHRRAQAAGKPIDINHVIDDYGIFVQKYNTKLSDDLNEKRAKLDELKTIAEATTTPLESHNAWLGYFKAQLEYDEWVVDHFNQPVVEEYYRRKIALDKAMLYGNKEDSGFMNESEGCAIVFVRYKQLELKRKEILNHEIKGVLEETLDKQLKEIDYEISNLTSPLYYDATSEELRDREVYDEFFNPITGNPEEQYEKRLYSKSSQQAILDYVSKSKIINEDYFEYDEVFGFEEELKRNLHIINSKELRDPQGHITQPMDLLLEDEQYRQAKEWVARNAKFVLKDEDKDKINQAFKTLGSEDTRLRFKQFAREAKAYDAKRTIDGTKFTDAQIAEIKREQELQYGVFDQGGTSDKSVIGIRVGEPVIYNSKFTKALKSNTVKNSEYLAIVAKINNILREYYDEGTGKINWSEIPNTKEGLAIYRQLSLLFNELQETKTGTDPERAKEIASFIEKYVDTELSEEEQKEFDAQETIALGIGKEYYNAWCLANYIVVDGERKPNRFIYHKLRPKKEFEKEFINEEKTEALRLIAQTYDTVPTEYYYQKIDEVLKEGKEAFNKWYYNNHIYNPNTGHLEPIRCWTTLSYKDTSKNAGDWVAKGPQTSKDIKPEYRNSAYKEDSGHLLNYKEGTGYDNPIIKEQTEFEEELKKEMESILYELALSDKDRRFIDAGYAPARRKGEKVDAKFLGKEFLKTFGWVTSHTGKTPFYDDIDYSKDKTVSIPMLSLFDQKKPKELNLIKPEKLENETDEQFTERLKKYEDDVKELIENNRKAHAEAIDHNWKEAFYDFIIQAGHLQAIQDNKQMLFYGKSIVDNYEVYQKQYGFFGDYKFDSRTSDEDNPDYLMRKDKNLSEQYDNWVRRLLYNQWKQSNERYTKWASRLQSITSAQYMMMNIRGGIANVTLGSTQIIAEAWARDFFNFSEWAKSDVFYMSAIPSFATHMYREDASSLADAIIKFFNVVDYDENTGRSRIVEEPTMKAFNRFRAAMYSPQTIGEHYMQNRALFAMLMSHRLYVENNPITGKEELVFKNEGEALQGADEEALMSVLSEELKVKFREMKEQISNDPNKAKDFAHFRQDLVNVFVNQYLGKDGNKQAVKDYTKARKLLQEKRLNEFKNDKSHPTLMSQLELDSEGYMGYKKDSLLAKYDVKTTGKKVTNADQLLADFRVRVISVNKKIHGAYDKMGQAKIEKYWFGSLVMQYHKHIPIGIAKRWKKEGSFNESRGTIEKGSYVSLYDFLATPWKNYKNKLNLTDGEVNALTGIQNILKEIVEFLTNIGMYWNILPEYEKNNIRRNLGDVCGVLAALFATVALKALADDDDEDSIVWNLALYEADRLGSETIQFNPFGAISEAKKLWSTPIAAQSGLEDLWQSMGLLTKMIFEGSDFDPYYHSGRFAGEHKLSVYIQRRIPIWRGIKTGFIDIVESNNYYKLGDNFNSKFADSILDLTSYEDQ